MQPGNQPSNQSSNQSSDKDFAHNKLIIIGDPKQAIYGFRGADVHTYELAKQVILSSVVQGQFYRLAVNYRSMPDLISGLNHFFAEPTDDDTALFNPNEVNVQAASVEHRNQQGPKVGQDDSGLAAINLLRVNHNGISLALPAFKAKLADQMARTIKHQLLSQVSFYQKGHWSQLSPSDVCVLIHAKADAKFIEKALDKCGIPHSYHKKAGLYQSIEASHFMLVLKAIAEHGNRRQLSRAMLTLFFQLQPADIPAFEQEKFSNINTLWLQLMELAESHSWPQFFTVLLEDSGSLFRAAAANNWRQLANLKQMSRDLTAAALEQHLDARGLLRLLNQWQQHSSGIEGEDLHELDTEQSAVQIMTIHGSKGLEFPMVFLFGGFNPKKNKDSFQKFYDPELNKITFDLNKNSDELFQAQELEENRRLYYVALTRAIYKLFLPVYDETIYESNSHYKTLVLDRLTALGINLSTDFKLEGAKVIDDNVYDKDSINIENKPESIKAFTDLRTKQLPDRHPSMPQDTYKRARRMHSFSALTAVYQSQNESGTTFSQAQYLKDHDEGSTLIDQQEEPVLPGGVTTGLTLHGIFEHVDFAGVIAHQSMVSVRKDQDIMVIVAEQMELFGMKNQIIKDEFGLEVFETRIALASMVWHTLRKRIDVLGGMCLGEIKSQDRRHELEFFLAQGQYKLNGLIDLLFRINRGGHDYYYILDWKSNYSANGYRSDQLKNQVMKAHHYDLQYRLYALAMQRWFDSMQLCDATLAGALYVFSRGIDQASTDQNGLFFDDFTQNDWTVDEVEQEFAALAELKEL